MLHQKNASKSLVKPVLRHIAALAAMMAVVATAHGQTTKIHGGGILDLVSRTDIGTITQPLLTATIANPDYSPLKRIEVDGEIVTINASFIKEGPDAATPGPTAARRPPHSTRERKYDTGTNTRQRPSRHKTDV